MNRELIFAQVAVPLPIFQTFSYCLPDSMQEHLRPGCRVWVPFGARHLTGLVLGRQEEVNQPEVKCIAALLDEKPLLSAELLELSRWVASYYFAPLGEALRVMLPPRLWSRRGTHQASMPGKPVWPVRRRMAIVEATPTVKPLTARQQQVLHRLQEEQLPIWFSQAAERFGCSQDLLRRLGVAGALRIEKKEFYRSPWSSTCFMEGSLGVKKHLLTVDQRRIVGSIKTHLDRARFRSVLIHGVTGSGKTEVYLNIIRHALEQGKSALVLVPEIGLTPQIAHSFRSWYGDQVAILHSALSEGERFDQWHRIYRGEARVVIGTRSAVFAPLRRLGVIIVDEEQDASYKQNELPRYHARDTALKRGHIEKVVVILGSATPQLETFHPSLKTGRPELQVLSSRILERPLPRVHIVDMGVEFQKRGKAAVISDLLKTSIQKRLERKEQVLILLNRRGYSPVLLCRSCGYTETCQNCSISLTYHHRLNRLSCHYCSYFRSVPNQCRQCTREYIYFLGEGTEKIQEILVGLFPHAVIDRLDADTTQRKGSLPRILGAFASGRTDLLVGTQMIAKGHDFPRVTLVGALGADQALRLPDFRAAEKTFQLLTQVAGRAGRGEHSGEVIIQTYYPNHYSLKHACAQDFRSFFDQEIRFRLKFRYPPFIALANLLVWGNRQERTRRRAEQLMNLLLKCRNRFSSDARMRVIGPAPASRERLKGEYRFQILIKTTSRRELRQVLEHMHNGLRSSRLGTGKISIDIDPLNLL